MQPSDEHDRGGVFTGCMIPTAIDGKVDGTLTALYTSVSRLPIHYTKQYFRGSESVALATSTNSGRTWTRQVDNIILGQPPTEFEVTGWRDPFVARWPAMDRLRANKGLRTDGMYLYAVVAGGIRGKTPTAFFLPSQSRRIMFLGISWTSRCSRHQFLPLTAVDRGFRRPLGSEQLRFVISRGQWDCPRFSHLWRRRLFSHGQ